MTKQKSIPQEFLTILEQEGQSLKSEGVADIALSPHMALRALEVLRRAEVAVTGGEVWKKVGDRFQPTYDIWNIEKADFESSDLYVQASLNMAQQQIKNYIDSSDEIFVSIGI
jgi:Immunity protein 40